MDQEKKEYDFDFKPKYKGQVQPRTSRRPNNAKYQTAGTQRLFLICETQENGKANDASCIP